jgi:hypothetical protein
MNEYLIENNKMIFDKFFKKPLDNYYKIMEYNNITFLELGLLFNQPIDNLPNSLTHLEFYIYSKFNQEINNLPNSLTHLTLGLEFNQEINNLPNSLTHLTLGYNRKIFDFSIFTNYISF